MIAIPGGTFRMGSEAFYSEEAPVVERTVAAFEIDATLVTNAQFAEFIDATGYVTIAERPMDPADFPGADPAMLVPGSLAFAATAGPVNLRDWRQWWKWTPGASWRHPFGPDSDIDDKADHPVVQVAYPDAHAYATWAGKRLATEAEWEFAARGGLDDATYAWGDEMPEQLKANTWQGSFPWRNTGANGWVGTSPVGSFEANGYGLFDMTGNTWEWTGEPWTAHHEPRLLSGMNLLAPSEPVGEAASVDTGGCMCSPSSHADLAGRSTPGEHVAGQAQAQRVLKGGSHMCAPEYCLRYRPAARSSQDEDSATTHIGFRCARSLN